jgi:hypothetical protein
MTTGPLRAPVTGGALLGPHGVPQFANDRRIDVALGSVMHPARKAERQAPQ